MNKKLVAAAVIIIAVVAGIIFAVSSFLSRADNDKLGINIYFFNSDSSALVAEKQRVDIKDKDKMTEEVIAKIIKGPTNAKNVAITSADTKLNSVNKEGQRTTVDFSDSFLTENKTTNALAVYAVVKTLCQLPEIAEVKVTAAGKDILGPDDNNIDFLSGEDINIEKDKNNTEIRYITLYFANQEAKLERERRKIKITDTQPIEQYIVNEIIKGPENKELQAVLSSETSLISAQTTDGTCFVNFNSNFVSKNTGNAEKENLTIYALVNSLTELDTVKNVQFLVNGKKITDFGNNIMSGTFFRDEEMITK